MDIKLGGWGRRVDLGSAGWWKGEYGQNMYTFFKYLINIFEIKNKKLKRQKRRKCRAKSPGLTLNRLGS